MMGIIMYQHIARILPGRIARSYYELLRYNDVRLDHDRFIGFVILFGLGGAFAIAFDAMVLFSLSFWMSFLIFLASYFLVEAIVYIWLSLSADAKGRFAESVLPDALRMMAMNVRAGMTTDRAMLLAARPEFGVLERELSKAGKQVLAGKEIKYALLEIPKRIKSETTERTIRLIVEGIESGGELSDLLEQTADDIQSSRLIQGEIQANVMMYAIFIFMAAGIGAPLLFGISTYLVEILGRQFANFPISETLGDTLGGNIKIAQGSVNVSPAFLVQFSVISLVVTSVFAGLMMGIIRKGSSKEGIRYIPMLLFISLAVFFGVRSFVSGIFTF